MKGEIYKDDSVYQDYQQNTYVGDTQEVCNNPQVGNITFDWDEAKLHPHTCPVCGGRGVVQVGFYDLLWQGTLGGAKTNPTEPCRSCGGTGVLWR